MVGGKGLLTVVCIIALTHTVSAVSYEEGDERLGYINIASDGTTNVIFNATSIQNGVILGLLVLVLGALILPLFGIPLSSLFSADSADSGYANNGYDNKNAYQYNSSLSKRSFDVLGPVLDALLKAKQKYSK